MILDTSAVVAILFREPEAAEFAELIFEADDCRLSAGSYLEISIVIKRQGRPGDDRQCDLFLRRSGVEIEPFTVEQAEIARQAFNDYGKGRHAAGLNFGDCFAYALAKTTGEPLLFKGDDFRHTDVQPAI